jgi:hypothetical protein
VAEKMMIDHEDLPFAPLAEGSPVHVAVLWGNPETGSAAVMVELPGEYREPWHSHSSTYHAVRVEANKQNAIASLSHSISR